MKSKSAAVLCLLVFALAGFALLITQGVGENKTFSLNNIKQGLDLKGGVSILYEADAENPDGDDMKSAVAMIQERLDRKGFTEAEVAIEGSSRIRVDIPGVDDPEQAISEIGATAMLFFAELADSEETSDFALPDEEGNSVFFKVVLTGDYVSNAYRTVQQETQNSAPMQVVALEFNAEGSVLFEEATGRNIGKPIYIFMDYVPISWPTVNSRISGGNAVITGNFTQAEAEELGELIKAGSLPFALNVIYMKNVGAKLGADALDSSILAGCIGLGLVIIFMLATYRFLGFTASLALFLYAEIFLIFLSIFNVTLTLPGIAGVILSVGMAVDANVIIFERVREELKIGKTLMASITAGFKRATPAVLDGNITTLIAAVVLFNFGSGPVRGFAQTLIIGVMLSMFSALIITRYIMTSFVNVGVKNPALYSPKSQGETPAAKLDKKGGASA